MTSYWYLLSSVRTSGWCYSSYMSLRASNLFSNDCTYYLTTPILSLSCYLKLISIMSYICGMPCLSSPYLICVSWMGSRITMLRILYCSPICLTSMLSLMHASAHYSSLCLFLNVSLIRNLSTSSTRMSAYSFPSSRTPAPSCMRGGMLARMLMYPIMQCSNVIYLLIALINFSRWYLSFYLPSCCCAITL